MYQAKLKETNKMNRYVTAEWNVKYESYLNKEDVNKKENNNNNNKNDGDNNNNVENNNNKNDDDGGNNNNIKCTI